MNTEWLDQIIFDAVGAAKELYLLSIQVVYNDAWIGIIGDTCIMLFVFSIGIGIPIKVWRITEKEDDEDARFGARVAITAIGIVVIFFTSLSYTDAITEYTKRLTTPEWYALERIERLVK